jgi:predicted metallo-beta-lactamase superfamily hydrolase
MRKVFASVRRRDPGADTRLIQNYLGHRNILLEAKRHPLHKTENRLDSDSAFQGFYLKIIGVQTLRRKT